MIALYIHVPFCLRKCSYCDFVSFTGHGQETFDRYASALCIEMEARKDILSVGVSSIYFGGGTPSLLPSRTLAKILGYADMTCGGIPTVAEITLEANPATAGLPEFRAFRRLGINRISMGIQSFNDGMLSVLGRVHTAQEAVQTYESCREAGFDNINLDLIFALPGQNAAMWKEDLQKAVFLAPQHLSIYNLQVEENTPMRKKKEEGVLIFPTEEEDASMYSGAVNYLEETGYKRYEISNFALDKRECRHNINYWKNGDYLGIGIAAHSHVAGRRLANTSSLEEYLSSPGNSSTCLSVDTPLSKKQENIFLGLRMDEGLPILLFENYQKEVSELLASGLLEEYSGRYRLSEKGVLIANRVFELFI